MRNFAIDNIYIKNKKKTKSKNEDLGCVVKYLKMLRKKIQYFCFSEY